MIVAADRVGRDVKGASKMMNELVDQGASLQEASGRTFAATGVYVDKTDAVLKTIISDEQAALKFGNGLNLQYNANTGAARIVPSRSSVRLSEVIDHPELFRAYPEAQEVRVKLEDMPGYKGSYTPGNDYTSQGTIRLAAGDPEAVRSTLLHEIQHAIQKMDGTERGSNVERNQKFSNEARKKIKQLTQEFDVKKDTLSQDQLDALHRTIERVNLDSKQAYIKYLNVPGEQEATFTQKTKDMDIEEAGQAVLELIRSGKTPQSWNLKSIPTK
jgi:hypothetical protein